MALMCYMETFFYYYWMVQNTTTHRKRGTRLRLTSSLEDLDYADDVALPARNDQGVPESNKLNQAATCIGLNINVNKTKAIRMNTRNNNPGRRNLADVDAFTYGVI